MTDDKAVLPEEVQYPILKGRLLSMERPGDLFRSLASQGSLHCLPELAALEGVPQDPRHHPEGDVLTHALLTLDAMQEICRRDGFLEDRHLVYLLAALCHDLGKPGTTEVLDNGQVTSHGHEKAGDKPTLSLLGRMGVPIAVIEQVLVLVKYHMVFLGGTTSRAVRKILLRVAPFAPEDLVPMFEADLNGRPPLPRGLSQEIADFLALVKTVREKQEKPKRVLTGLHLLSLEGEVKTELGMHGNGDLKRLLMIADRGQAAGDFRTADQAVDWLMTQLKEER